MRKLSDLAVSPKWLFLAALFCAQAAYSAVPVEVVQSVPIETSLAVPGIRFTQQVWLEMIASARRTIDLEEFYIDNQPGQALEPVLEALQAAALRGVQVRIIIDSQFYLTYHNDPDVLSRIPGIQVRVINFAPLGGVQHSKYFVVDQDQVFLGSANLDWLALTHIHEVGLHLMDPGIATQLESIFEKDWQASAPTGASPAFSAMTMTRMNGFFAFPFLAALPGFQLFASPISDRPPGIEDTLSGLLRLLSLAKTSIKLQVYEYATAVYNSAQRWTILDTALRQAAARGVHLSLLVDHSSLKAGGADLQALAQLKNVDVRVVTIPQWSGGYIPYARLVHSKYLVVDDTLAWVGTENWSGSYFTGCRNVGLIFEEPQTVAALDLIFAQVWNSPYISPP